MSTVLIEWEDNYRMVIKFPLSPEMTDDEFLEFCRVNPGLRIERAPEEVIVVRRADR